MELKLILQRSQIFSSATEKFLWRWSDKKTEWCKYSANDSMLAESIIMEQIEMEWVLEHQLEKRAEECEQKCLLSSLDLVGTDGVSFSLQFLIWSIQFYLDIGKAGTSPFLPLFRLNPKHKWRSIWQCFLICSELTWKSNCVFCSSSLCKSYPRLRWGLQW